MNKELTHQYQKAIHEALEKCQFIEETLRMYISHAIDIAKIQLSLFPLKYTNKDISKLSMGKLVHIFSRISDDATLNKLLEKIPEKRNHVAHQSLLFTIGESQDPIHMQEQIKEINRIKENAKQAHDTLSVARCELLKSLRTLKRQEITKRP